MEIEGGKCKEEINRLMENNSNKRERGNMVKDIEKKGCCLGGRMM